MSKRKQKLQGEYEDWKQIENFIKKVLEKRLKKDQEKLKILTEGDLQSCVYHHLRGCIKDASNWYILNNLSMGKKGKSKKIPDIVILYWRSKAKPEPVFLIASIAYSTYSSLPSLENAFVFLSYLLA